MKTENTTAPPKVQHLPVGQSFAERAGFEYHEVQVVYEHAGCKHSFPGVLDVHLAQELKSILEPEVFPSTVRVIWAAGWASEFEDFLKTAECMSDLIKSVRTAERPGHELRARLGQFGPYEGYAPQNAESENVARNYEGNPTFAERIKLAREDAGLTQVDLAKACGISQANISELERGEVGRTSYLPEIARACGASTDWLAFGNETLEVQP